MGVTKRTINKAIDSINKHHFQLVYPIKNSRNIPSLWQTLYPRSKMRWDWSEDADERVVEMWHLKDILCNDPQVIYAKWYRGRATFLSRQAFAALLRILGSTYCDEIRSNEHANEIYQELLDESPQTPKSIKASTNLNGKYYRKSYESGIKNLWEQLLIVGTGEVDEGAFPALAIGASKHIYEDLWDEAKSMKLQAAYKYLTAVSDLCFSRYLDKLILKYSQWNLPKEEYQALKNAQKVA